MGVASNSTPKEICSELFKLVSADFDSLKRGIKKRMHDRIYNEIEPLHNFISNYHPKEYHFENRNDYEEDPFLFSEYSMAYYCDSNQKLWVYLSPSFENIIREPINKKTGESFPPEFIMNIEQKIRLNTYFEFSMELPQNLEKLIISLKKTDELINTDTDVEIQSILQIAKLNNISKDDMMNVITIAQYVDKFNVINVDFHQIYPFEDDNVSGTLATSPYLSPWLGLAIICKYLYLLISDDLVNNVKFFEE